MPLKKKSVFKLFYKSKFFFYVGPIIFKQKLNLVKDYGSHIKKNFAFIVKNIFFLYLWPLPLDIKFIINFFKGQRVLFFYSFYLNNKMTNNKKLLIPKKGPLVIKRETGRPLPFRIKLIDSIFLLLPLRKYKISLNFFIFMQGQKQG